MSYACPVCGYDLGFEAWSGDFPSDEICPSCGLQFGYDDALGGKQELRPDFYRTWREKWMLNGYKWSSHIVPPQNWNPQEQLKKI